MSLWVGLLAFSGCAVKLKAVSELDADTLFLEDVTAPDDATSIAWSVGGPVTSTSITATWVKSTSGDLANQKIQYYSDAGCTTPQGAVVDLGSAAAQSHNWTAPGDGTFAYQVISLDASGNSTTGPCSGGLVVDTTGPAISIGAPSAPSVIATTGTVTYTVTYTGAASVNLTNGDINLNTTGGASCAVNVTNGTTATPTVTFSNCSGVSGTVGFDIDAGTAQDALGNPSAASADSDAVMVTNTASKLVFSVEPSNAVAGDAISAAIKVQIQDASSNLVATATNTITLAFGTNAGSGTLSGTVNVAAVAGVATFSDISIDKIGTGYTLVASSGALATDTSAAFNITPDTPTTLVFKSDSPTATSRNGCAGPFTVEVKDTYGNLSPVSASTDIDLAEDGAGAGIFYDAAGCGAGDAVVEVAVAGGASQAQFWFKHDTDESLDITASAGGGSGLTDATRSVTVGQIEVNDTVARVSGTPADNVNLSTASFTPPNGSLLLVLVNADRASGQPDNRLTIEVSDTTGLTWNTIIERNELGAAGEGYTGGFYAKITTGAAMQVRVKRTVSNGANPSLSFKTYVITGHDPASPIGATGEGSSTSNAITPTIYTSTVNNSRGFGAITDWSANGVPTSSDTEDVGYHNAGFISGNSAYKAAVTAASGTAVTMNFDAPGAGATTFGWIGFEVKPAP